ncbi:hypothetical protein OAT16_05160 [Prolixibacteraceae bacterium]|nr:hypothetical protein [Prolixibacteraceae bacterium]
MKKKRDNTKFGTLIAFVFCIIILVVGIKMCPKENKQTGPPLPEDTLSQKKQNQIYAPNKDQKRIKNQDHLKQNNQPKDRFPKEEIKTIKPIEKNIETDSSSSIDTTDSTKEEEIDTTTKDIAYMINASYKRMEVGLFPNINITTYSNNEKVLWVASLKKVSKFLVLKSSEIKYIHSLKYPGEDALKKDEIKNIRQDISKVHQFKELKELLINKQNQYKSDLPITNTAFQDQFLIGKGIHLYLYSDEEIDATNSAIALQNMWTIPKKSRTTTDTRIIASSTDNKNIIILLSNGQIYELDNKLKVINNLKLKEDQTYNSSIIRGKNQLVITSNKGIYEIGKRDNQWTVTNFTSLNLKTNRAVLQKPRLLSSDGKQIFVAVTATQKPKILFYQIGHRETDFPYFTHEIESSEETSMIDIQVIHNQLYLYTLSKTSKISRLDIDYSNKRVTPMWEMKNNVYLLLHNNNHDQIFSVSQEAGRWRINSISTKDGRTLKYFILDLKKDYLPINETIQPIGPNHFVYTGVLDLLECQIIEP